MRPVPTRPARACPTARRYRVRGISLIEALVALVVMSVGILSVIGLTQTLRRGADLARQRGDAVRLAGVELQRLRSFATLSGDGSGGVVRFDEDLVNDSRTVTLPDANASFIVTRSVTPVEVGGLVAGKAIRVEVRWTDRAGEPQFTAMDSWIARQDPAFSGALPLLPPAKAGPQAAQRHPAIPAAARPLGNGLSAFRPSSLSATLWVFNNQTGHITAQCDLPPATPWSQITASSVADCAPTGNAYLLSGSVRFSLGDTPSATSPESSVRPFDLAIVGASYSLPVLGPDLEPLPGQVTTHTATPPNYRCFTDAQEPGAGTRAVASFHCLVMPDASSRVWSGQLILTQLPLGSGNQDLQVCRYSADYNGNGSRWIKPPPAGLPAGGDRWQVDNFEHPSVYAGVLGSLTRQNFLVIRARSAAGQPVNCPGAPAVNPNQGIFVDHSTVAHQP